MYYIVENYGIKRYTNVVIAVIIIILIITPFCGQQPVNMVKRVCVCVVYRYRHVPYVVQLLHGGGWGVGSRLCVCACVFISRGQGHATNRLVTSPFVQHTLVCNRWCRRRNRCRRRRRRRRLPVRPVCIGTYMWPGALNAWAGHSGNTSAAMPIAYHVCCFSFSKFLFSTREWR